MSKSKDKNGNGISVTTPDVDPRLPSHVAGVHQGNWPRNGKNGGRASDGDGHAQVADTRSTGINAEQRKPVDPRMPKLTPA